MRKITTLLASGLLVGALALPAQAATTAPAVLSVSVNASLSITFTDNTAAFGPQNAGTTTEQIGTLAYTTSTNNATGLTLTLDNIGGPGPQGCPAGSATLCFALRPTGDVSYTNVGSFGGAWRTTSAPGTDNFTDDAQVTIGSLVPAGTNASATVNYVVTSNA